MIGYRFAAAYLAVVSLFDTGCVGIWFLRLGRRLADASILRMGWWRATSRSCGYPHDYPD